MNIKKIYTLIIILSLGLTGLQANTISDTLTMGNGYENDLFYSMNDGLVSSVEREGWDIAFYSAGFSAGIIINDGAGVKLYTYPNGDTSNWNTVDSTGMTNWEPMANSPEYWENGAFNRNALGHPDYGWGIYNSITHNVVGDSVFVIEIPGLGFKKLWIVEKVSIENVYHLRFANLDGSEEAEVEIDIKPFASKIFAYYSFAKNEVIDREPSASWDILFTKYYDITYDNQGNAVEYLVTGATLNLNCKANKFYPVAENYDDWSAKVFDSLKNSIGYNWKTFNMNEFQWVVEDSTAFFVKNEAGDVFKLVFDFWEGTATGVFALNKEIISTSSIFNEDNKTSTVRLFPNPATKFVNIVCETGFKPNTEFVLLDISGRVVFSEQTEVPVPGITVKTDFLKTGIYFLRINGGGINETQKLIIR